MQKDPSSTIVGKINKVILMVIIILGTTMLFVSLAHIFWRYVLNDALTWSEELLKIMMVWFSLLSTTVISYNSSHLGIVVFREMLPLKVQKALLVTVRFLILISSVTVTFIGISFVYRAIGQTTPSLGIPYSLAYSAVPLSFFIMSIYEINHIKNRDFMEEKKTN